MPSHPSLKLSGGLPLKGGDVVRCVVVVVLVVVVVVVVAVIFEVECVRQLPQSTSDLHHSDTHNPPHQGKPSSMTCDS
jgi:predicted metalloprotease